MSEPNELWGVPRPDVTCMARVEIRLPGAGGKASMGRPWKVWQGSSDTDETLIHATICENQLLAKIINQRKVLGQDGSTILSGKLSFFDSTQTISRHDIEIWYISLEAPEPGSGDKQAEQLHQLFVAYSHAMVEVKKSTDEHVAKLGEGFSSMAKSFSEGLGKLSEHGAQLGKLTRKLERDRRKLSQALLAVATKNSKPHPQAPSGIDTAIKAVNLIKGISSTKQSATDTPIEKADSQTESGKSDQQGSISSKPE